MDQQLKKGPESVVGKHHRGLKFTPRRYPENKSKENISIWIENKVI